MSIIITGSNGQLGLCIQDELNSLGILYHALPKELMKIEDQDSIISIFDKLQPSAVINAAAYTNVDLAETNAKEAFIVNGAGPENLSHACNKLDIPLIHISTDFVFNGKSTKKYTPQDIPDPISVYGQSKLQGEENIMRICKKFFIIRTSWVFSSYGNNFLKTVLKLSKTREEISIIDDQIGCPTHARDLAKAIVDNLKKFKDPANQNTIFHFSGDQPCSWYDFGTYILSTAHGLGYIANIPKLLPIKTDEYKSNLAVRPQFSALDSMTFCNMFNVPKSNWKIATQEIIKELILEK